MAGVKLEDVIDVVVFRDMGSVESTALNRFVDGGLVTQSELLNQLATAAGKTAELPFWKDLDGDEEVNYSSDDLDSDGETSKVTQGEQVTRKAFINKGWKASDLATELAMGANAMEYIRSRTDKYLKTQFEKRLIASARGVYADNVANDSGDMVIDISTEDGANAAAANRFSREAFISAAFTSGDHFDNYMAVGMHSGAYKQAVDQDDVEDVRDADGRLLFQTYMGRRILIDDSLPVIAGTTSGFKFMTVLYGEGAFGWGEGSPETPVEVERQASKGDGGGVSTLWRRETWIVHPFGFAHAGTPGDGRQSFNLAEMAEASKWDRVIDRKLIPMAFLIHN